MTTITVPAGHACANRGTHGTVASSVVRIILKCMRKPLCTEALQALAGRSGKDGVAFFSHSERIQQLFPQIEGFQHRYQMHELTHATGNDVPIDLARLIAKANNSVLTSSAPLNMRLSFDHGHDELVVSAWSHPFQEFCLHSCPSGFDVVVLHCAARQGGKTICNISGAQRLLMPWALKNEVCNRLNAIKRLLQVGFDRVAFPPSGLPCIEFTRLHPITALGAKGFLLVVLKSLVSKRDSLLLNHGREHQFLC
ncbi:hypothetical protein SR914_11800 [Comamonas testosteroni]|uniref:hypothetical protein n=1 Tax=Comamonas testosteroni TaxID=285 RepID=UPI00167F62FD|nr:hypothetical protein [Comamonas testosteroni]WQG69053.1 hypothetical protein SR914_11800 [Comamonas testosteroni]